MTELFLNLKDETGEDQSIPVEREEFVIGRHSENDLSIVNPKLSREHIKIQRFADVFVVSDLGSSNGTTINGEDLTEPVGLKDGDVLNLGGGLEIEIEMVSDDPNAQTASADEPDNAAASGGAGGMENAASAGGSSQGNGGSGLGKALILAPLLGLFLLFSVVGAILLIGGKPETEVAERSNNDSEFITSSPLTDKENEDSTANDNNEATTETPPDGTNSDPVPVETSTPPEADPNPTDAPSIPKETDEIEKIRGNSFKFMREIARSNQKPVLLNNQLALLENKIKQVRNSGALAGNIKNAQNNASAIKQLADSKKLNPSFLATAAIARMGSSSGDVLTKAREMADILDKLQIQIGDEQADDNLIMIAAYDQGVRNDFLQMRNTLQRLADKNPNRASEIRSIWFLKEKGAINDSQFEFALRFLAVGTITQNPEAFNVQAKALNF